VDLRVCTGCGAWMDPPRVLPAEPVLVCAECGRRQPFRRLPLFSLTGPSGTGKSTVCRQIVAELTDRVVVLEQDVLWTAGLTDPTDDFQQFRSTWLRMAGMIHQSGRPVVLCGTVVPVQFEQCPERAFVGEIFYLALVCQPDVLRERLRARPAWRGWDDAARIEETLEFNDWVRAGNAGAAVELLDTTALSVPETVAAVTTWVERGLRSQSVLVEH
jgi:broad-specificity NMP kinase